MKQISIVIPCLNEQEVIPVYYREMEKIMEQMRDTEFGKIRGGRRPERLVGRRAKGWTRYKKHGTKTVLWSKRETIYR